MTRPSPRAAHEQTLRAVRDQCLSIRSSCSNSRRKVTDQPSFIRVNRDRSDGCRQRNVPRDDHRCSARAVHQVHQDSAPSHLSQHSSPALSAFIRANNFSSFGVISASVYRQPRLASNRRPNPNIVKLGQSSRVISPLADGSRSRQRVPIRVFCAVSSPETHAAPSAPGVVLLALDHASAESACVEIAAGKRRIRRHRK